MKARQREARQFEDGCFVQWRHLNTGRQRQPRSTRRELAVLYFLQVAGAAAGSALDGEADSGYADGIGGSGRSAGAVVFWGSSALFCRGSTCIRAPCGGTI